LRVQRDNTLQNIIQPIGVSTYRVTRELPEPLQAEVPSIEDLQEVVEKLRKEMNEAPGTRDGCGGVMTGEPVMSTALVRRGQGSAPSPDPASRSCGGWC
jgi:hypothetical protein